MMGLFFKTLDIFKDQVAVGDNNFTCAQTDGPGTRENTCFENNSVLIMKY